MAKTLKTVALLEQPFIKDGDKTVATIVKEAISALGENIQVRRFERWANPKPKILSLSTVDQHPAGCTDRLCVQGGRKMCTAHCKRRILQHAALRRFVLGEGMEKKAADLAAEVEAQTKAFEEAAAKKAAEAEASAAAAPAESAAAPAQVGATAPYAK